MSQSAVFKENYHGVLCHDGWIKVAKFNVQATILNIQGKKIQAKTKGNKSIICNIHKNLTKDIRYMDIGDTVGIKWNCGRPYIVGYRKSTAEDDTGDAHTGDAPVSENMDWISFFEGIDAE